MSHDPILVKDPHCPCAVFEIVKEVYISFFAFCIVFSVLVLLFLASHCFSAFPAFLCLSPGPLVLPWSGGPLVPWSLGWSPVLLVLHI